MCIALIITAIVAKVMAGPLGVKPKMANTAATGILVFAGAVGLKGATAYNEAGYCQHVQTILGTESMTCDVGWYMELWGRSTSWPHFITVAHSVEDLGDASYRNNRYPVRLADNWSADVTQATRFGIPKDRDAFIKMHKDFKSPDTLIRTTLKPAVTSSLDSVANMFTMEEYYAGGQRDAFKTEYLNAVSKGRPEVERLLVEKQGGPQVNKLAPSDDVNVVDTSEVGDNTVRVFKMEKVLDESGNPIRQPHNYVNYGISVSSAIVENLDPDDIFEAQIQERKNAASRRMVAQQKRLEQEEQRLLVIQTGQTEKAKRQADAQVEQIEKTTNAETTKQLALVEASKIKEEAAIAKETAQILLEKARLEAQTIETLADAEAYQKRVVIEADGALAQKLEAWVTSQKYWAEATSNINVPTTVFGSGGDNQGSALGMTEAFMSLMTAKTAKDLQLDMSIKQ